MFRRTICRALLPAIAGAMGTSAWGGQSATDFDDLVNAHSIHCEFFRSVRPADMPAVRPADARPEVLVHYAGMNREGTRARVVSTRRAGARDVIVIRTEKAVHFVDHAAGVYAVTTVFGCNERDLRATSGRCLSYGAVNSRHFDPSVRWQPDNVFERDRHLASHGFCDHSFVTAEAPMRSP
jgi:hypothetical protein